jgi:hypothetical protein
VDEGRQRDDGRAAKTWLNEESLKRGIGNNARYAEHTDRAG